MDKDTQILRLVNKIYEGKMSPDEVKQKVDAIERQFGDQELLYSVEDRNDQEYYDELLSNARIGVYTKASLVKMAEIKALNGGASGSHNKTIMIVAGIAAAAVVVAVIIILSRR